jgi:hypothetical protein
MRFLSEGGDALHRTKKRRHERLFVRAGRPVTQLVSADAGIAAEKLYGRRLTLPMNEIYHNVDAKKRKICPIIETRHLRSLDAVLFYLQKRLLSIDCRDITHFEAVEK